MQPTSFSGEGQQGLAPQIVHASWGRLRAHLPNWSRTGQGRIEAELRPLAGVSRVEANPFTGNVLITFEPTLTSQQALLAALQALRLNGVEAPAAAPPALARAKVRSDHQSRAMPRGSPRLRRPPGN